MKFALKNSFVAVVIACAMTTQLNAMELGPELEIPGATPGAFAEAQAAKREFVTPETSPRSVIAPSPADPKGALEQQLAREAATNAQRGNWRDFSKAENREQLMSWAADSGGFSNLSDSQQAAYRARQDALHQAESAELNRKVAQTAEGRAQSKLNGSITEPIAQPAPRASTPPQKAISQMSMAELEAHANSLEKSFGKWDKVPRDVRTALNARHQELKRAEKGLPAEDAQSAPDADCSDDSDGENGTAGEPDPLVDAAHVPAVPGAGPSSPKGPSRFDRAVKYMREHKLKTAAITTGLVLGIDFAYAYRTKVTAEEKQNNRLHKNLLLAAGRTKTAAILGKLKDVVQSRWARKS